MKTDEARYIGDLRDKSEVSTDDLKLAASVLNNLRVFDADFRRHREVTACIRNREMDHGYEGRGY